MDAETDKLRRAEFVKWFEAYGPSPFKYIQALDDPHQVIAFRRITPSMGRVQAVDLDLTKFPHPGQSVFTFRTLSKIKDLFEETRSFRVGDDGAMHTAIGYYAMWLRLVNCEEWKNEPFWELDCAADGSATGKTRMATLLNKGFNYRKVWQSRMDTYKFDSYLAAIRTKPFLLLAGISGTGKSRLVRQLARGCCPEWVDDAKTQHHPLYNEQKPGNFEMIPVRPNWHDSSELMGYVTRITDDNKPKYVIKPFVKFLVKAMIYSDVPFFLCLDEMNLAPVEQYFAEYLSVVETRKVVKNDAGDVTDIVSDVLVDFDQPEIGLAKTVRELMQDWIDVTFSVGEDGMLIETIAEKVQGARAVYERIIADKGVRIPRNFIVMGTVNMDETTCSFSRKVLDRAMTFELNEVDMDAGLTKNNEIPYGEFTRDAATATAVEGFDFYGNHTALCDTVKTYLQTINNVLEGTPFKFAYRSRNEIMLYCIERTKGDLVGFPQALDEATSMKVLSRIEGDDQKLTVAKRDENGKIVMKADGKTPETVNLLEELQTVIPAALKKANSDQDPNPPCKVCADKLAFMRGRLEGGFTNFFV